MSDSALPKLEQLIEQLISKNASHNDEIARLTAQNEQLAAQVKQLEDDNETLQLEALEQEENHAQTISKINAIVGRLEQEA
ncbi:cell division protein ZapB [Psychrobium sp. MM17-31]|uniref:cell division protein ZapB n=1 Tax=Psychrobium sp. MM17-31 TaxID=2917758 RepID=UPI001EF6D2CF|nr:cell division protein ZapB [Psychrobium sp. MM17-31]MCG7532719.1 cell division protein ZapB [Psychrobium sp. MM17-31]